MSLQRTYIEDVLEVLREIQNISSANKKGHQLGSFLRMEAVRTVANRELRHSRFKNFNSAQKSIGDACSRRLRPAITNIGDFDRAVEQWLSGNPEVLRSILLPKTDSVQHRNELESLLNKVDSRFITPTAADINEPIDTKRMKVETYRILRDTALAREIKEAYKYKCQICYKTLLIAKGTLYAEAHHIKPLGNPHNGPDERGNIICVCPNCHVLLDYGGIILDSIQLNSNSEHNISTEHIEYHNENIFKKIELKG